MQQLVRNRGHVNFAQGGLDSVGEYRIRDAQQDLQQHPAKGNPHEDRSQAFDPSGHRYTLELNQPLGRMKLAMRAVMFFLVDIGSPVVPGETILLRAGQHHRNSPGCPVRGRPWRHVPACWSIYPNGVSAQANTASKSMPGCRHSAAKQGVFRTLSERSSGKQAVYLYRPYILPKSQLSAVKYSIPRPSSSPIARMRFGLPEFDLFRCI